MIAIEAKRYDQGMWLLNRLSLEPLRRELLREASGRVLEIGVGTGANRPLYGSRAQVAAIDLKPAYLAAARARGFSRANEYAVVCAGAESLPFPDGYFDAAVGTLVFCSIHNPVEALAEIRRTLRPGGRLLLLEHVRGQTAFTRVLTDWLHPFWFALQGECRLNRETAATVAQAGFRLEETRSHGRGLLQLIRAVAPE